MTFKITIASNDRMSRHPATCGAFQTSYVLIECESWRDAVEWAFERWGDCFVGAELVVPDKWLGRPA